LLGDGDRGGGSSNGVPGGGNGEACRAVDGVPGSSLLRMLSVFIFRLELALPRWRRTKGSSVMVRGFGGSKREMSIFSTKLIFWS